jgi:nicotinamidase/pyrazinamidase
MRRWTRICACPRRSYVIEDACRGIDLNGSLAAAWKEMQSHGVKRIQSADIDASA